VHRDKNAKSSAEFASLNPWTGNVAFPLGRHILTTNLQGLVWVPDEQTLDTDESVAIAYAVDGVYVYRRVTRLADDVLRTMS